MDTLIERCAGIDIGKDTLVACVRTPGPDGRGRAKRTRTFTTFTTSVEAMAEWFTEQGVTAIVMEATGSYWKPVWYLLEDHPGWELMLVNAHHVKILPAASPTCSTRSSWPSCSNTGCCAAVSCPRR